jgi:glycerol-3-phosphate cytidylyltransferase
MDIVNSAPKEAGSSLILTYGTFDLFHYGHMRLLQRARSLGTRLAVGLSTDEFNVIKGKRAFMSYEERAELLMACRFVDEVFPERCWEQKASDIVSRKASILVMGDDWKGKFDHLDHLCAISYLERTPLISSTMLREGLKSYEPVEQGEGARLRQA